jgi:2,3-dihydroxybiphenyl 1,2-dioxygenase
MPAIARLGYLGFEASDLTAWELFAVEVLGLGLAGRGADGSIALWMDEQAQRIVVHPGQADDLAYLGFEVEDDHALRELAHRLSYSGFPVTEGKPETARARRVGQLFRVADPSGVPVELFHGPERTTEPFRSAAVASGFVTGEEGLGHLVLVARDAAANDRFYREILGMKLSDRIHTDLAPGLTLDITFLHANPRHHTVAFTEAPLPKRIHHFMVELGAMEDVGRAYDRCLERGVPIANTLGQHPNDGMFSFYARTPSGFEVEIGWGGRKVDDATWKVCTYDRLSSWGHRPPTAAGV